MRWWRRRRKKFEASWVDAMHCGLLLRSLCFWFRVRGSKLGTIGGALIEKSCWRRRRLHL
jgi:hypothetical protein